MPVASPVSRDMQAANGCLSRTRAPKEGLPPHSQASPPAAVMPERACSVGSSLPLHSRWLPRSCLASGLWHLALGFSQHCCEEWESPGHLATMLGRRSCAAFGLVLGVCCYSCSFPCEKLLWVSPRREDKHISDRPTSASRVQCWEGRGRVEQPLRMQAPLCRPPHPPSASSPKGSRGWERPLSAGALGSLCQPRSVGPKPDTLLGSFLVAVVCATKILPAT